MQINPSGPKSSGFAVPTQLSSRPSAVQMPGHSAQDSIRFGTRSSRETQEVARLLDGSCFVRMSYDPLNQLGRHLYWQYEAACPDQPLEYRRIRLQKIGKNLMKSGQLLLPKSLTENPRENDHWWWLTGYRGHPPGILVNPLIAAAALVAQRDLGRAENTALDLTPLKQACPDLFAELQKPTPDFSRYKEPLISAGAWGMDSVLDYLAFDRRKLAFDGPVARYVNPKEHVPFPGPLAPSIEPKPMLMLPPAAPPLPPNLNRPYRHFLTAPVPLIKPSPQPLLMLPAHSEASDAPPEATGPPVEVPAQGKNVPPSSDVPPPLETPPPSEVPKNEPSSPEKPVKTLPPQTPAASKTSRYVAWGSLGLMAALGVAGFFFPPLWIGAGIAALISLGAFLYRSRKS